MMNAFDHLSPGTNRIDVGAWNGAWDRAKFQELADMIGARQANRLVTHFRSDLRKRFANSANRESLRRDAHAMTSSSELLGFAKLSETARRLEAAIETGEAFESSLQAIVIAKEDAIRALDDSLGPGQTAT